MASLRAAAAAARCLRGVGGLPPASLPAGLRAVTRGTPGAPHLYRHAASTAAQATRPPSFPGAAAGPPPAHPAAAPPTGGAGASADARGAAATPPTTHFGSEEVPLADKARRVSGVFTSVATHYDTMNDAMSLGVHRWWKDAFVRTLAPVPGMAVVDVAGGTGDIAFRILAALDAAGGGGGGGAGGAAPTPPVRVLDVNPDMLAVGRRRAAAAAVPPSRLTFAVGDAEALPLPPASVDAVTISFGMRNVSRPATALAEAVRVLRPGGRFLMMEFATVRHPALAAAYDAYSGLLPAVGAVVAGDAPAYRYLVESIRRFPGQDAFGRMMRDAGLQRVRVTDLTGGVVAIYSGWKGVARPKPKT